METAACTGSLGGWGCSLGRDALEEEHGCLSQSNSRI